MADHGHGGGHAEKHEKHESHGGGKGSEWLSKVFGALAVGIGVMLGAPIALAAANIIIPQYLGTIGLMAGAYSLGKSNTKKAEGGHH